MSSIVTRVSATGYEPNTDSIAVQLKSIIPPASIFRLLYLPMMSNFLFWPTGRAGTPALRTSAVPRFLRTGPFPLATISLVTVVSMFGGGIAAYVGQPLWLARSSLRSRAPTSRVGDDHLDCFGANLEAYCDRSVMTMTPARARPTVLMAVVSEDDHHIDHFTEKGENIEFAAEVRGVYIWHSWCIYERFGALNRRYRRTNR